MNVSEALYEGIALFELDVNAYGVMPPYWINTPDYSNGFKGAKGSPEDMQGEVNRIVSECLEVDEAINVYDEESARNFLYRNQVGIDCSGFAYHLIDRVVEGNLGNSFSDYLFIPKEGVVAASKKETWRSAYDLTASEASNLPPMVPLNWVCETFEKEPASQVNVARLCNDAASAEVPDFYDIQAGDLIQMKRDGKSKHIGIVAEAAGNEFTMWDSYREDRGYGGIRPHSIKIIDASLPLETQKWLDFETTRYDEFIIRRPNVFQ